MTFLPPGGEIEPQPIGATALFRLAPGLLDVPLPQQYLHQPRMIYRKRQVGAFRLFLLSDDVLAQKVQRLGAPALPRPGPVGVSLQFLVAVKAELLGESRPDEVHRLLMAASVMVFVGQEATEVGVSPPAKTHAPSSADSRAFSSSPACLQIRAISRYAPELERSLLLTATRASTSPERYASVCMISARRSRLP